MNDPLPFGPWWEVYRRLVSGDDDFPVVPAALAMSHILQGGQTWPQAEPQLARLEQAARRCSGPSPRAAAEAIVRLLTEEGFRGDDEHYEDPVNSFLDRVLERRRGLPIALSVLAVHLARHAGVPLHGIGFPGHFVVGLELDEPTPLVLDPFVGGRVLDGETLEALLARATGGQSIPGGWRRFLRPASSRDIATRMLRNLVIHLHHAGRPEHAGTARRLLQLTATPEQREGPRQPD